jgi:hypothetical protein
MVRYANLRATADEILELADGRAVVSIPIADVRKVALAFGSPAERPILQGIAGSALLLGGVVGLVNVLRVLLAGVVTRFITVWITSGVLISLGIAGGLLLARLMKRSLYLAIDTARGRRKLEFSRDATREGAADFVRRLEAFTSSTHRAEEHHRLPKSSLESVVALQDVAERDRFLRMSGPTSPTKVVHRKLRAPDLDAFEFRVEGTTIDMIIDVVADYVTRYLEGGAVVRDGQTWTIGWFVLLIEVRGRVLRLLAPQGHPPEYDPEAGLELNLVVKHGHIPWSYGLEPNGPTMNHAAVVGEVAPATKSFLLTRGPAIDGIAGHSGWLLAPLTRPLTTPSERKFGVMRLYDLAVLFPDVVDYLSMPEGTTIEFDQGRPTVLFGGRRLDPTPGSLADTKLRLLREQMQ